jgi:hypothetical protein
MNTVTIEQIVKYLEKLSSDDDMASVQINSDGLCIIRQGVSHTISMNVANLKERINVSPAM